MRLHLSLPLPLPLPLDSTAYASVAYTILYNWSGIRISKQNSKNLLTHDVTIVKRSFGSLGTGPRSRAGLTMTRVSVGHQSLEEIDRR
ncbi:hypothetical protein B0J18DRAFT_435925 [Chaetomium sp. MPI-SDFR-AT-0129]|nr:hypothetical protein B0J18DRAFT_435925 [Chaetomium sp. MPI-SDFR-AT-0129]